MIESGRIGDIPDNGKASTHRRVTYYPSHDKTEVNKRIVEHINITDSDSFLAVILDDHNCQTSKALIGAGISPRDVVVCEHDSAEYSAILKNPTPELKGVRVDHSSMHDVIETLPQQSVDFWFGDYMCSFDGNNKPRQACKPQEGRDSGPPSHASLHIRSTHRLPIFKQKLRKTGFF